MALKTALPQLNSLSEVSSELFKENKSLIENATTRKRIAHVVGECERVKKSVTALKKGDLQEFGKLLNASHDSLRDDYEVTCPELDFVVSEGRLIDGVYGIRMTGGGFGGCTVAIVAEEAVDAFIKKVGTAYFDKFGHKADFYVTEAGNGCKEIV